MAPPLSKDVRKKILEFLKMQDVSDLSAREIAELIKENTGTPVSPPTASKLKCDAEDELAGEIIIEAPPMGFDKLRQSCREFFSDEGHQILYELARNGTNREKLEALRLIMQYGYGRPNNKPDNSPLMLSFT
jgi:hypothetical protein